MTGQEKGFAGQLKFGSSKRRSQSNRRPFLGRMSRSLICLGQSTIAHPMFTSLQRFHEQFFVIEAIVLLFHRRPGIQFTCKPSHSNSIATHCISGDCLHACRIFSTMETILVVSRLGLRKQPLLSSRSKLVSFPRQRIMKNSHRYG